MHHINSHLKFGIKPGLKRIQKLLSLIGNPQDSLSVIHTAGTNGKGSTCLVLSAIFKHAGYKTGLYTSPSIIDFRDRIKINGKIIPKKQVVKIYSEIKNYIEEMNSNKQVLTEFEIITAMALKYFKNENCNIVILETGLGGRLDATNIIKKPLASILTSISLDHTDILGSTIEGIAREKCGIIKKNVPVITSANQEVRVLEIIKSTCRKKNTNLIISGTSKFSGIKFDILKGTDFYYNNQKFSTSLIGYHQIENIANALLCIETINNKFPVTFDAIKKGLKNLDIKSRIQVLCKKPLIILDGSHNLGSVEALKNVIDDIFIGKKIIGIVGMFKDKDVENSLSKILPAFDQVITIPLSSKRSMDIKNITEISLKYNKNTTPKFNIKDAIKFATSIAQKNIDSYAIIIFGSLSIANQILN
ncbi:MAG: bifunctional folylpolyglutamate synthase/dihydrofolate synthase [Oscillospiraceae bacterium]|nr:bifunctional folylpolyglutamate synthase/dihydrofolate synthase [Oscillospiraceae bacterium]